MKGLEPERQRIDEEIADIQKRIRGGGQRSRDGATMERGAVFGNGC